ncbi:MAG: glycosyltransferase family 2 protein [Sandaracinaceae bacterium]|nr:glycosyltransferase family 2 protein [Sandaracinaceae bacterium]
MAARPVEIVSEERSATAPSLSVIVFAFDEEENIGAVLSELALWLDRHEPDAELVFVDDGSRDATAARAKEALAGRAHVVVRHARNGGIGAALKTGVRHARGTWITFLPADGQIAPEAIGTLRDAQRRHAARVVFSVYRRRDDGLDRKLFSFGVRALIAGVHGVWMKSDGPYLVERELFDPDALPPDTFFLNFELPIRLLAKKTPSTVVTIECRPRRAGSSKSTQWHRILGVAKDLGDLRMRRWRERLRR